MKSTYILLIMNLALCSCANSQEKNYRLAGGPCEGCEAVFEYGDRKLTATDTLPDFESAQQQLLLTGTIYESDGKSPAEGVILYIHHTNPEGIYPVRGDESGWGKRHGYLRGWIKTGKDGRYEFYTQMPGTYPDRSQPAHIHPYLLEPDGKYYWVDTYFFEGDPLLTAEHLREGSRGGSSGVVRPQYQNDLAVVQRDFYLGVD